MGEIITLAIIGIAIIGSIQWQVRLLIQERETILLMIAELQDEVFGEEELEYEPVELAVVREEDNAH